MFFFSRSITVVVVRLSGGLSLAYWVRAVRVKEVDVNPNYKEKRPTATAAKRPNHLVTKLGRNFLIPFAETGNRTERLDSEIIQSGMTVYTFGHRRNSGLIQTGAKAMATVPEEMRGLAVELGSQ